MASAITSRATFSFHHLPILKHSTKPSHISLYKAPFTHNSFIASSVDISKDDKPVVSQSEPEPELEPEPEDMLDTFDNDNTFDRRVMEEKFAVLNTGIHECRSCGYLYNEKVGDPTYPIPPGLQFDKLPEDWRCATCGAAKSFFESKSIEIAGFAQNQQFGLGGNTLTSGQKTLLIYGSLLAFFALFLSGYWLP